MSARTGTIQGARWGTSPMAVAAFVLMVAIAAAVIATSMASRPEPATTERPAAVSAVSGTEANTPSEIRREAAGGSVAVGSFGGIANTPSELRGGRIERVVAPVGFSTGNTPTELSGGMNEIGQIRAEHQAE